jgi:ADP-heptose:LPS heptosyltransferase
MPPQPRRTPEMPAPVTLGPRPRILVIKLATLGDVLLATPALRALRLRYPAARLDVLTTADGAALLADSPLINRAYTLDKYAFDYPADVLRHAARLPGLLRSLASLRTVRYDAVLLAHHLTLPFGRLKYRLLLAALGARLTAGLDNGHGDFLDLRVPDLGFGVRHEAEYALALAAAVDAPLPAARRALQPDDLGWVEPAPPRRLVPPLVALHPGSGTYSTARRWPAERFATLARALHTDVAAAIVLVGGSEEAELHEEILARLDHVSWARSTAGQLSVRELAHLLRECALLVANDSLPMHLAALVGTPVVAVFGPSNHQAWGPFRPAMPESALVVRRGDLACSPCFYRGHALGTPQGCPPRPCLTELAVEPVLRAARQLLERAATHAEPAG